MTHEQHLLEEINVTLRSLASLFPHAGDRMDQLARMYTATYMLRLRVLK